MQILYESNHTIVIEKSRFITYLKPVENEQEFKDYLKEIRKKHYDATHIVSALIINDLKRCSDDGEPAGTAGMPTMSSLEKRKMNNICALTVRYFGGIKLGTGGLVRAYSQAVSEALDHTELFSEISLPEYEIIVSYETANKIDYLLAKSCPEVKREYAETVRFTFLSKDPELLEKLTELTHGQRPLYIQNKTIMEVQK